MLWDGIKTEFCWRNYKDDGYVYILKHIRYAMYSFTWYILNNYIVIYFSCNWWSSGGFVVDHFTCDVYCLSNEKEGWRKLPTGRTEVHKLFIHEGPWQGILCMIHWHYSTSFQNTLELESFLHHLSRRLKEASLIKICPLSVVIVVVNFSHFYLLFLQNHWANLNITVSGRKAGPQYHTFYIGI